MNSQDKAATTGQTALLNGEEIKIETIKDVSGPGPNDVVIPVNIKSGQRRTHQTRMAPPLIQQLMARSPECQLASDSNRDWDVLKDRVSEYGENQVRMHDAIESVKALAAQIPGFNHSQEFNNAQAVYDNSVVKTAPIYDELANAVEGRSGNVSFTDEADYLNLADRTMTQIAEQTTIYSPISIIVQDEMSRMKVFKQAKDAQAADPTVVTDVAFKEVPADGQKS